MESVKIRKADKGDIPDLLRLAEEFMPREASMESRTIVLKESLASPHYELLVADSDGKVIGFIDQWITSDFTHGGKSGFIHNFYVMSKYRRKGIGSKLLRRMIENAIKKDVIEIHVATEFANKPAIALYKSHGFTNEALQLEMEIEKR
ncbi:MAG: GNAT family N-acetyltransferase [Candidatus Hodarchaeota archaeon]